MKKSVAILLTALYLLFNVGAILNVHYCGNTVDRISFVNKTHNCCSQSSSCCHDLAIQLSIKGDYAGPDLIVFKVVPNFEYVAIIEVPAALSYDQYHSKSSLPDDAPLLHLKNPIYLSNGVLLI